MDIQLKRGLLDVCVLKVLDNRDSYGYQIIKDISPHIEISESTLYPILKRLGMADMLSVYSVEHNSRIRKYYRLTEAGKTRLLQFREEWKEMLAIHDFITREEM